MKKPKFTKNNNDRDKTLPEKSASHHDKFFKRFFSHPKLAVELIQLAFSKEEAQKCDLSKLKVEKTLFKDKKIDLLLSFPLKALPESQIRIVILCEHKSRYDKNTVKQALRYQTALYEDSKQVVAVIPVLFHHGKPSWKWELSFQKAVLGKFFSKIIKVA